MLATYMNSRKSLVVSHKSGSNQLHFQTSRDPSCCVMTATLHMRGSQKKSKNTTKVNNFYKKLLTINKLENSANDKCIYNSTIVSIDTRRGDGFVNL